MYTVDSEQYRYVIGTLGKGWVDSTEGKSRGKLDIIMEEFRNEDGSKTYSPINQREHFCDTEKVFITGPFDELEKKFNSSQLLVAEVTRANRSEENQQNYIAYYKAVQPLKNADILEVLISHNEFDPDNPNLYSTHIPSTKLVMLCTNTDGGELIQGPFSYDASAQGEDGYKLSLSSPSTPLPGKNIGSGLIGSLPKSKCTEQLLEVTFGERLTTFMADAPAYLSKLTSKDYVDVMDSESLLRNYVEPLLKDSAFRSSGGKLTKKGLEVLRNNVKNSRQFKKDQPRYLRTINLLSEAVEFDANMLKLKDELLSMPEGQKFLESYLDKNESEFYKKYRATNLEQIDQEVNTKRLDVERLERKRHSLLEELKTIAQQRSEKEDELRQMEEKRKAELEERVLVEHKRRNAELQKEISDRESLLSELKNQYSQYKNYESLLEAIKSKESEFSTLVGMIKSKEDSLENLTKQIDDSSGKLTEQFVNIKAGFEAMTQSQKSIKTDWDFVSPQVKRIDTNNTVKAQQEYIEQLDDALCSYGRHLDTEQLVNLVTTIAQNQFTICSGLPGTGKTSLIKRLGMAMNLGNRQHTISVSRGWMSSNDVLGYYNGLSHTYQPAATGLWELLNTLQDEEASKVTPAILLLDEMNLSSPEHYFSSFLDLADGESKREIFTGFPENERLFVPDYLRFIGTINSDETVQPLSPRMLDRAAVIPFDGIISDAVFAHHCPQPEKPVDPISASDWLSLFEGKGATLSGEPLTIFNEITNVLEEDHEDLGKRVIISYRKRKLIADFVDIAGSLLVEYEGPITALDRAILQHVLPSLSGYGAGFAERLNRLHLTLKKYGLEMSAKCLRKIILEGDEALSSYRYVA
ncbi:AAA family ATPase [Vibrio diabolicus]|uniref:AAA family ATPase n=1 Tax=Vibrio diabolicus TaxID=50719 RepID=UPI002160B89A|nr:AAA family ATPase [Vibrio diabolicus]MCS0411957.1 AAA family ATPase [Vibrio diabolicus]